MARIPYLDGLKHGTADYFDLEGNVVKTETFIAGKLNGAVIERLPNGTVIKRSEYQDDLLNGTVTEYNHKGRETHQQLFSQGAPGSARMKKTRFGYRETEEGTE